MLTYIIATLAVLFFGVFALAIYIGKVAHDNGIKLAMKNGRIFCNPKDDI